MTAKRIEKTPRAATWGHPYAPELYRRLSAPGHEPGAADLGPREGEVRLTEAWYLDLARPVAPMVRTAARDLTSFLAGTFGLRLAEGGGEGYALRVVVDPVGGRVQGTSRRDHVLEVTPAGITVTGVSEWGAACGLYHLQRLLKLRGAPALPLGTIRAHPALDPAVGYPALKTNNYSDLEYPRAYPDNYLARLARAGYSGFHFPVNLDLFYSSGLLPALSHPEADANRRALAQLVNRARRHALQVYLTPYVNALPEAHPVFRDHPELRGSVLVGTSGVHLLCSSQPLTADFYAAQFRELFRAVPDLAGVFLITGCEGFLHCYTAPAWRGPGRTDCPHCSQCDPEEVVGHLISRVAQAVKEARPEAEVVAWTYGTHTWTKTHDAAGHIAQLSRDCALMANLDSGDWGTREGVPFMHFDYNLTAVGPSQQYLAEAATARRRGLKVLAKLESATPIEFLSIPSVPALTRWARKFRAAREHADGAMLNWDFSGYTESLSGELAGWMAWEPCPEPEALLRRMAARDFGPENQDRVLAAWRQFDRAMDHFPLSNAVVGYWRGPFYLGFAQPLILDPLNLKGLSPDFWYPRRPPETAPRGRPSFFADLSWTQPFGPDAMLAALRKLERHWRRGCDLLNAAVNPPDALSAQRLDRHQALAEGMLCMFRTAINMVRFLVERDEMYRLPSSLRTVRRHLGALRSIAREELANAESGLACMRRNPLLGFDHINCGGFTPAMVECKLAHTRKLIETDLPMRMFQYSFAMQGPDEWLGEGRNRLR